MFSRSIGLYRSSQAASQFINKTPSNPSLFLLPPHRSSSSSFARRSLSMSSAMQVDEIVPTLQEGQTTFGNFELGKSLSLSFSSISLSFAKQERKKRTSSTPSFLPSLSSSPSSPQSNPSPLPTRPSPSKNGVPPKPVSPSSGQASKVPSSREPSRSQPKPSTTSDALTPSNTPSSLGQRSTLSKGSSTTSPTGLLLMGRTLGPIRTIRLTRLGVLVGKGFCGSCLVS